MYIIPNLPLTAELETRKVLKKLASAHRHLAELKGVCRLIPNQDILINTLSLQEAKDSSAIENIITTHDEIFQSTDDSNFFASPAAKEVHNYAGALRAGYNKVSSSKILTNTLLNEIQSLIVENSAGYRSLPGTELKNSSTGETVYTPPQDLDQIKNLMANLEKYINTNEIDGIDPLIKMAIIHHQFESIHPYYDGNGRTGRIINVLYLVKEGLLDAPILYISRYINQFKSDYYSLIQGIRDKNNSWEEWVCFILDSVEITSKKTSGLIVDIHRAMEAYKNQIRQETPKIYSHELLDVIFSHPYTKLNFLEKKLGVTRITATKYLNKIVDIGLMKKMKVGKNLYFINNKLFEILSFKNESK